MLGQRAPGEQFEGLTSLGVNWRRCWLELWAPQDGRFQATPLSDGKPGDRRWEAIYWIGSDIRDADLAAKLLTELGYGYEILLDSFDRQYVVLTDYRIPALAWAMTRFRRTHPGAGQPEAAPSQCQPIRAPGPRSGLLMIGSIASLVQV